MFSIGLSMLSIMLLSFLKMIIYPWRYMVLKFDVRIGFCSILDFCVVLMKINGRFLFAMACWSFPCIQFRFLDEIVKSRFLDMNPNPNLPRIAPIFVCMAISPSSQSKHSIYCPKRLCFVKWIQILQKCHSCFIYFTFL